MLEEDEEGSDSEPEGQDIDELYHFVRQTHQQETRSIQVDVQHPALTPVLRPYQREAVNWMLQQEHFKSTPAGGKYKIKKGKLIRGIKWESLGGGNRSVNKSYWKPGIEWVCYCEQNYFLRHPSKLTPREIHLWVPSSVKVWTDFSNQSKGCLDGIFKNQEIFYMPFQLRIAFVTWSDGNLANIWKKLYNLIVNVRDRKQVYKSGRLNMWLIWAS